MATSPQKDLFDAHTEQPSLAGRRVAITGGTTGIGRAIAVLLASEGARVFICGRDENHLGDALARIREVGEGDGLSVDLSRREDIPKFFDAVEAKLGGVDAVVINHAIPAVALADTAEADIAYQTATNFAAYLLCAKAATERLGEGGNIVLVGSMSAETREAGSSVYVAAKAGIEGFAEALRRELGERNIKVGLIEPGLAGSDLQYPDIPAEKQRQMIHEETMLRAEDIAVSAHFMLTQPRRANISMIRVEPRVEAQ